MSHGPTSSAAGAAAGVAAAVAAAEAAAARATATAAETYMHGLHLIGRLNGACCLVYCEFALLLLTLCLLPIDIAILMLACSQYGLSLVVPGLADHGMVRCAIMSSQAGYVA